MKSVHVSTILGGCGFDRQEPRESQVDAETDREKITITGCEEFELDYVEISCQR